LYLGVIYCPGGWQLVSVECHSLWCWKRRS